ncbi:hypothetical protein B0H17DRAFT_1197343 [Mycena rosella]|uniref:Uncharacterized protein n=1 Tax=Mycena rosella TaxID=1033263 RepID=A0AAD7GJB2_MYCRO|nr:hypothetical protein B0H17DRAFT_1197343 [Mycena rosella]
MDGPYCTFNQEWERAFQKKSGEPPEILHSLVSRGKHGLILAYTWAAHYTPLVAPDELFLVELRIQTLLALITAALAAPHSTEKNISDGHAAEHADEELDLNEAEEVSSKKRKPAAKGSSGKSNKKPKKNAAPTSDVVDAAPVKKPKAKPKAKPSGSKKAQDKVMGPGL